ncbi:response regulator [Ornithinibacillus bavariensis]|uniref:DNA-binding response regulator n=1 Tax=Ornithinibacillus bavariensis TaxID=545502 RepID=A0A919XAZ7_9BACI|nr:response regulator [Ornithinibacillus bavariensis]GIO27365.1 DNA-binding response regulator [Ornithinibacillus bavariensis]
MRVVLIDDEYLPLLRLKDILENEIDNVEVVGVYQDSMQAYKQITSNPIDVLFMDIEMPGINGLELAEKIQEVAGDIEIVFVTGYSQYAIEAFELFAFDYILKPIRVERLKKTIEQLSQRISNKPIIKVKRDSENSIIQSFNQLKVQKGGTESETLKWRTSKAQELFAYLLHHRGKTINRGILVDLLWPSVDLENGMQQLYTTIYHIRRTLKQVGLDAVRISSRNGGYTLENSTIRIETEEWEEQLINLDKLSDQNSTEHEKVFYQYKGDYLGDYSYLWAEGEKERLKRLWINHGIGLIQFYRKKGDMQAAIKISMKIQQMYPEEEDSYFELMMVYASMNKVSVVEEQFQLLQTKLKDELNVLPSQRIIKWYQAWKGKSC